MVAGYLALVEAGRRIFCRPPVWAPPTRPRVSRHMRRRAARFGSSGRGEVPFATHREGLKSQVVENKFRRADRQLRRCLSRRTRRASIAYSRLPAHTVTPPNACASRRASRRGLRSAKFDPYPAVPGRNWQRPWATTRQGHTMSARVADHRRPARPTDSRIARFAHRGLSLTAPLGVQSILWAACQFARTRLSNPGWTLSPRHSELIMR